MSATTTSAPRACNAALRGSRVRTIARTGTPRCSSSETTAPPVLPVAPVTRIVGCVMFALLVCHSIRMTIDIHKDVDHNPNCQAKNFARRPMRMSQDEKDKSHGRIVASASRLLRERGLAGASVDDVMKAAGMTHGGFYKHFDNKEALVEAAMDAAFAEFTDALERGDPQQAVAAYR